MCCFSRPVKLVAGTRIFARALDGGLQALVYQMKLTLDAELAMILPLPVAAATGDDAVRFVDLSGYEGLFDDLDRAFPPLVSYAKGGLMPARRAVRATLAVHTVGDFEASYVPSVTDFDRLDPRFRLPAATWDRLPAYRDHGFAVFKLRQARRGLWRRVFGGGRAQTFHPMALTFPRRDPDALFFPTVHVHDGEVHDRAGFDHALFCQLPPELDRLCDWERSDQPAARSVDPGRTAGMIDAGAPLRRIVMMGDGPNRDTIVHAGELRARVIARDRFALRWRIHWQRARGTDLVGVPEHPSWARDLPAATRAAADRIADAIEALAAARGEAWGLVGYDATLPRTDASHPHAGAPQATGGPCRLEAIIDEPRLGPYVLIVELAFGDRPTPARRDEVDDGIRAAAADGLGALA
jgi:hypothetical protein